MRNLSLFKREEVTNAKSIAKALRKVHKAFQYHKYPRLRACGLSEQMAEHLFREGYIQLDGLQFRGDTILDIHRVEQITPKGQSILVQADVENEPFQLRIVKWVFERVDRIILALLCAYLIYLFRWN